MPKILRLYNGFQVFIGLMSNVIVFPVSFGTVYIFRKTKLRRKSIAVQEIQLRRRTNQQRLNNTDGGQNTTDKTSIIPKPKRKHFQLPWYFLILAWILLWVTTITAGAFTLMYGITFGESTTKIWISSMMASFLLSIFVTQPIKVRSCIS